MNEHYHQPHFLWIRSGRYLFKIED